MECLIPILLLITIELSCRLAAGDEIAEITRFVSTHSLLMTVMMMSIMKMMMLMVMMTMPMMMMMNKGHIDGRHIGIGFVFPPQVSPASHFKQSNPSVEMAN